METASGRRLTEGPGRRPAPLSALSGRIVTVAASDSKRSAMSRRTLEFFTGCMLGGAVGDALGAPVEFITLEAIRSRYGPGGVTGMEDILESEGEVARFTDDTQMALFTAEGLLRANSRMNDRGLCNVPSVIRRSYVRWLHTQGVAPRFKDPDGFQWDSGWLITVRGLHARRAPGNTCLSALSGSDYGTVERPINDSKGCGGVMRVAPVGLLADMGVAFDLGCQAAALTHGHPSGYLSAGCLAMTIAAIIEGDTLEDAIRTSLTELKLHPGHQECLEHIERALALAAGPEPPAPEAVERLGAGWVAEEALAISLYCSLAAGDEFAKGVLLAVNHGGDSDSTGAITGNILGALLGKASVPGDWLEHLEMRDLVEEIAADLLAGWRADSGWIKKYPTY